MGERERRGRRGGRIRCGGCRFLEGEVGLIGWCVEGERGDVITGLTVANFGWGR